LAVAVCLIVPALLPAQGTGGRIIGRVADPSGAVLGKVRVTAVNDATGVTRDARTSESGDYVFPDLPVGTYTLSFELTGFKKDLHKSIALDVNQVITLNMTMQLGAAQEVVDVTSEAPLVDTTSTQLGAVVNNRSVNELPLNARDTYQFLQLQARCAISVGLQRRHLLWYATTPEQFLSTVAAGAPTTSASTAGMPTTNSLIFQLSSRRLTRLKNFVSSAIPSTRNTAATQVQW